jgi:hypothetical protein
MARGLCILLSLLCISSIYAQTYNLIFLNEKTLVNNRKIAQDGFYKGHYYKNEDLSLAVKRFDSVAKSALNQTRVSVIQKKQVPPSGDKHDYYSQALYYWPNNYTRGGWPYVHRDGIVNPEASLIPDSSKFEIMYNKFSQLSLMYFYSGNKTYAQGAIEFLRTWFIAPSTAMNPNLNYASLIPGFQGVRGEGVIEMHKIVYMFDYLELIKPSGLWSPTLDVAWRTWLTQYFNWLITDPGALTEATRLNKHGTYCALQLVTISLYLNNLNFAGSLIGNIQNLLDNQMGPDSSFPRETSTAKSWFYSVFNLEGFFSLAQVAEQFGFDLWHYNANGNSIEAALDYLIANYHNWPFPDLDGPPDTQNTNTFLTLIVKARQVYGKKYDDIYNQMSMSGITTVKHASQVVLQYLLTQTAFDLSPIEAYFQGALVLYSSLYLLVCFYYFFLYKIWYKSADELEEERLKQKAAAKPKVAKPSSPKKGAPKSGSKSGAPPSGSSAPKAKPVVTIPAPAPAPAPAPMPAPQPVRMSAPPAPEPSITLAAPPVNKQNSIQRQQNAMAARPAPAVVVPSQPRVSASPAPAVEAAPAPPTELAPVQRRRRSS